MDINVFIKQNIWYIYIGFIWLLFMYVLIGWYRKRGKIKVRIKTPLEEKVRWIKPEADGKTIVMEKAGKKKMGWSFEFTNKSLVPLRHWWGGLYYAVDIFFDASKAIEYEYALSQIDQPKLTKEQAREINRLDAFKRRYGKVAQPMSSTVQWIMLFLLIGIIILLILSMRGVRIV